MIEQELKNIWTNENVSNQISIDTSELKKELSHKINRIQQNVKRRDLMEVLAAFFGIAIFGYMLYLVPFMIMKLSCLLGVLWFVFIVYKFRKSSNQKEIDLSLPLVSQLKQQKKMLLEQIALLNSSVYWYVLPPFIVSVLFIIGLEIPSDQDWNTFMVKGIVPVLTLIKIIAIGLMTVFFGVIFWINKRAVKKELIPILKDVEKIENELE